jgi:hypothetical protein
MLERSQGCDSAGLSAADGDAGVGRGREGWDLPTALAHGTVCFTLDLLPYYVIGIILYVMCVYWW